MPKMSIGLWFDIFNGLSMIPSRKNWH